MEKLSYSQLAEILDSLNKREIFTKFQTNPSEENLAVNEVFKRKWEKVNQFLAQLSAQLKATNVTDEQKEELIRQIFSENNQYTPIIQDAISLFIDREIWLDVEHHCNIMNLPQKSNFAKHPYSSVKDYMERALLLDYDNEPDFSKKAANMGYYRSMVVHNLTPEGEKMLMEEDKRYEQAINIIPSQVHEQLLGKVARCSNPLETVTNLMRLYANDPTLLVTNSMTEERVR